MGFKICFVYDDTCGEYTELMDLCAMLRVPVSERPYNPYQHSMDRDHVASLPAFHVITDGEHRATLYPGADLAKVEPMLGDYYIRKARRNQRSWRRIIARIVNPNSKNGFDTAKLVDGNNHVNRPD
jgi:hypothetical protein